MVWVVSLSAVDLITRGLTARYIIYHSEFVRVW
jgi:hypothetical protein